MIIRGKNVTLRPIEREDLEIVREMLNNPDIERSIVGWLWPLSQKDEQHWYESFSNSEKMIRFIIQGNNEPCRVLGMTGIREIDWKNGHAEGAGVRIVPDSQSKGVATEAYRLMLGYCFNQLRLHSFGASALESNAASRRFLQKVGFKEDGIRREWIFKNGGYQDLVICSITSDEYDRLYGGREE